MSFFVVIPARYASERLPGKPLADIAGKPMIVRVAEAAARLEAAKAQLAEAELQLKRTGIYADLWSKYNDAKDWGLRGNAK